MKSQFLMREKNVFPQKINDMARWMVCNVHIDYQLCMLCQLVRLIFHNMSNVANRIFFSAVTFFWKLSQKVVSSTPHTCNLRAFPGKNTR
jgi:hypothetical protein